MQDTLIVCYTDNDNNEHRVKIINNKDLKYIQDNFDNVEVLSIKECLEHGIGFPS